MRQIHEVYFFLEIIANLFHHKLLLINVDLVVFVAEAADYDEPWKPLFVF
jgi:hypothetical protein